MRRPYCTVGSTEIKLINYDYDSPDSRPRTGASRTVLHCTSLCLDLRKIERKVFVQVV